MVRSVVGGCDLPSFDMFIIFSKQVIALLDFGNRDSGAVEKVHESRSRPFQDAEKAYFLKEL